MYDLRQTAVRLADTAMLLLGIKTALDILIRLFPQLVIHSDLVRLNKTFLLNPLTYFGSVIALAVLIFLYLYLKKDIRSGSQNAGTALLLMLICFGILPVFSVGANWVRTFLIRQFYSTEHVAVLSMTGTAFGFTGLISALTRPLLCVAAALNYAYHKQTNM